MDYQQVENDLQNENFEITSLADLRRVYEELESSDFSYSFPPIQAKGDKVKINLSFTRKNEFGEYEDYKELKQTIPVSGTWKVAAGVGLCFGALDETRYRFTIREETIVADELDQFIPIVSSFVHFYRQSPKSLNLGASFGVGLPILGGSDIQAASFFLGPTIIIGESNRFLLTGGIMGARAERLASGFEIGDEFIFFEEALPTIQRYELGYFIGLSFNVF